MRLNKSPDGQVIEDWGIRRDNTHFLYGRELAVDYRPGTALLCDTK